MPRFSALSFGGGGSPATCIRGIRHRFLGLTIIFAMAPGLIAPVMAGWSARVETDDLGGPEPVMEEIAPSRCEGPMNCGMGHGTWQDGALVTGRGAAAVPLSPGGLRSVASEGPAFTDFPATESFEGTPAAVDLDSHQIFEALIDPVKDMVIEMATRPPNFAGAFHLVAVPCGTACEAILVIDARSGRTLVAPIAASSGVDFRPDSRLIEYKADEFYEEPPHFVVFDGQGFTGIPR